MLRQVLSCHKLVPLHFQGAGHIGLFLLEKIPEIGRQFADSRAWITFRAEMKNDLHGHSPLRVLPALFALHGFQALKNRGICRVRMVEGKKHQSFGTLAFLNAFLLKQGPQGMDQMGPLVAQLPLPMIGDRADCD